MQCFFFEILGKKVPSAAVTNKIKNEKALFCLNPKDMTLEQIAKFVKAGNVEQLEIAVLLGKGKHILGKATWNDAARNYIKSVPSYIEDVNEMFKHATDGDLTKFVEILKKNKKYLFARDSQGRTPLHVAAQNGHAAVVKKVLSENAEYTQITDPVSILWYYSAGNFCFNKVLCMK